MKEQQGLKNIKNDLRAIHFLESMESNIFFFFFANKIRF